MPMLSRQTSGTTTPTNSATNTTGTDPTNIQSTESDDGIQTWIFVFLGALVILAIIILATYLFGSTEEEDNLRRINKAKAEKMKK
jgi:Mn2+/Fe2+ NRAMP family transporter